MDPLTLESEERTTVIPPLPPLPPSLPPMPSSSNVDFPSPPEMSNIDVVENHHLDIDTEMGDQFIDKHMTNSSKFCENMYQNKRKLQTESSLENCKMLKLDSETSDFVNDDNTSDGESRNSGKLEFDILDEINEDQDDGVDSEESDSVSDGINEDEIDEMLDESLKVNLGKPGRLLKTENLNDEDLKHEVREKIVLKALGRDHFELLPEGWIEVTHNSGMPVYLHKDSRVCTFSPPYFLGPGSARQHEIPISAIPCLNYARELEKKTAKENFSHNEEVVEINEDQKSNHKNLPNVKVENVDQVVKDSSIDSLGLRNYCEKLFEFHTITVRKFKTWASKRKHQKLLKQIHRPTLPSDTKLITCQVQSDHNYKSESGKTSVVSKEFVMNPTGKSYVCVLHEYVQHSMRVQPRYKYKELENASFPYAAIVHIKDMEYGTGYGSSKKQAKSEAAKNTLEILIPQMKNFYQGSNEKSSCHMPSVQEQDLSFFDEIRVEDPRVHELCAKAGLSSPFQLLLECLKRNHGMGDTDIKCETKMLKHQKNDFTMTVGKHKASVICKNKKDGKQRASQAILQALHPHISCWGSLLRLYGKGSCKTIKEKKQEEQQITELQNKACANKPNYSILEKLKEEMMKLKKERDKVRPIGKFIPTDDEIPSVSASNIKNVEL